MLTEELGLHLQGRRPLVAGLITFAAFVLSGLIPLIPFFLQTLNPSQTFALSAVMTGTAFLIVGLVKGIVVGQSTIHSGLETVLIGGAAAALAYFAGTWLRQIVGTT
jgi:VIT1/CCC1 family predicted Fe2+/Mn2+ transporter